jgi:peptide chain release factor 3
MDATQGALGTDHTGAPVFLARNAWHLDRAAEDWPGLRFLKTKEQI